MKTPIIDFVKEYSEKNALRLHMPGHKGESYLGFESFDITEINGADSLFEAKGIIKESEENASRIFGCDTFYSAEGSSLCIRSMLYLALNNELSRKLNGKSKPLVIAGRNAHKTFISAAALIDFDVEWIYCEESYLSCNITADDVEKKIISSPKTPSAVYLTSPDYLGNMLDIKGISNVCKKYDVPLLVDNAHGAYLRFLSPSLHPIDLGAQMCCDSAHKTLPCITGGAYLHISKNADEYFSKNAKEALSLFASTSPSYLILQSLDFVNKYVSEGYEEKLFKAVSEVEKLKRQLLEKGFTLFGNEPLKLTIKGKAYGYTGKEIEEYLEKQNIVAEFSDEDFIVFMLGTCCDNLSRLKDALLSLPKKNEIKTHGPFVEKLEKALSIREGTMTAKEEISVKNAVGRILASPSVGCPPAVPIAVCGEVISENTVQAFEYYGVEKCYVVK